MSRNKIIHRSMDEEDGDRGAKSFSCVCVCAYITKSTRLSIFLLIKEVNDI